MNIYPEREDYLLGRISPVAGDSEPLVAMMGIDTDIKSGHPNHRKFYIVRERPSMQIVSYGWTPEDAWAFALRHKPPMRYEEMDKYFDTVILVERPEGW